MATEPDLDTVTYSLSGTDAQFFDINSATGALTFKNAPNFEAPADAGANNVYDVVVTASDGSLTDTQDLAITVTNVDEAYRLQLLHLSDGEAGTLAPDTAPYLAALVDKFEDQFANSITLAGGDTFLPGPFLAAGTDPSLIPVINAVTGSTISTAAGTTPAPGVVDTAIHNLLGVEATGIGNHEWDLGSNVYLSSIAPGSGWVGAQYASISANLVLAPAGFPADPLNGRFTQTVGTGVLANEEAQDLKGRIAPSAVINEGGQTIGLVGVTTQILESISSPTGAEILGFRFGAGANGETNDMALLAAQLQPVIDDLRAQGVNKIVLLSHLQQITFERQLAPLLNGVDIILAAGSNTRLGDADDVAVSFPGHAPDFSDTYPILTAGADGKPTLIVNTDNEYTYLGRLVVDFNEAGEIITSSLGDNVAINGAYASTEANVAAAWNDLDGDLSDTAFAAGTRGSKVKALTDAVDNVIQLKDGNVYGYSNVYLEGERIQVRNQETNLGNVSADANADVARDALGLTNEHAVVSIKNGGGIRAQIGTIINNSDGTVSKVAPEVDGEVSQLDVENALRFDNKLMVFDTTAQGLLNILNTTNALNPNNGGFIQIGGVRFSYNPGNAAGSRV
ncbi:MAG: 5'-nucleotidase C-terminal domain-containing protein, partial [Terrimicrobiaceae bacterium]